MATLRPRMQSHPTLWHNCVVPPMNKPQQPHPISGASSTTISLASPTLKSLCSKTQTLMFCCWLENDPADPRHRCSTAAFQYYSIPFCPFPSFQSNAQSRISAKHSVSSLSHLHRYIFRTLNPTFMCAAVIPTLSSFQVFSRLVTPAHFSAPDHCLPCHQSSQCSPRRRRIIDGGMIRNSETPYSAFRLYGSAPSIPTALQAQTDRSQASDHCLCLSARGSRTERHDRDLHIPHLNNDVHEISTKEQVLKIKNSL